MVGQPPAPRLASFGRFCTARLRPSCGSSGAATSPHPSLICPGEVFKTARPCNAPKREGERGHCVSTLDGKQGKTTHPRRSHNARHGLRYSLGPPASSDHAFVGTRRRPSPLSGCSPEAKPCAPPQRSRAAAAKLRRGESSGGSSRAARRPPPPPAAAAVPPPPPRPRECPRRRPWPPACRRRRRRPRGDDHDSRIFEAPRAQNSSRLELRRRSSTRQDRPRRRPRP